MTEELSTETQMALLKKDMGNLTETVREGFAENKKGFEANTTQHAEIMEKFEKAMEKKAGKWVESVMIWVGSVIGVAIIGALMSLILINK